MSRAWRVLDLTESEGSLRTRRGQLVLDAISGESHVVPIADVAIVLLGHTLTLHAGALHQLAKADVAMLPCDWRGVPCAGLVPWGEHTRVGARHVAQAAVSRPRLKNAWMRITRAKIAGQAHTLRAHDAYGAERLASYAASVRSGDPNNLEAAAARWYWSRLFAERDFSRDYEAEDAINAMLNYGYAVLRGFGIRAVQAAGLNPALGVFHSNRSNYFNLVEDLIEPFRPVVDAVVASLPIGAAVLDPSIKHKIVGAVHLPFTPEGTVVSTELTDLAQRYGIYLEGGEGPLVVRSWAGAPTGTTRGEHAEG